MESEAMLSVPTEARWLFVTIMLCADDVGLFEATEFKLARKADVNRDLAGRLMGMLADADLIRLYEVSGKRYGFIPKFGQRVQITKAKHPLPPAALFADDEDAARKINNLGAKTTVGQQLSSAGQPPEVEVEVEDSVSSSSNSSSSQKPRRTRPSDPVPACPFDDIVRLYNETLPELPKVIVAGKGRKRSIGAFWTWVLTSKKSDGERRAATADQGLTWISKYFERVRDNDFLMGRTAPGKGHEGWRCTLDFLVTEKGLRQVIERTAVSA